MKKYYSWLILFLCAGFSLALRGQSYAAGEDAYTKMIKNWWEKGPLIAIQQTGKKPKLVTVGMLVKGSPAKVWKAITDYEKYPDEVEHIFSSKVVKKKGNVTLTDLLLNVKLVKAININLKVQVKFTVVKPNERLEFTRVKGDLGKYDGYWQLIPVDGGKHTMLFYGVSVESRTVPLIDTLCKEDPNWETIVAYGATMMVIQGTKDYVESH